MTAIMVRLSAFYIYIVLCIHIVKVDIHIVIGEVQLTSLPILCKVLGIV